VTVRDDGLGLREGSTGTGIGLKNIHERLRLSYGDGAFLRLSPGAADRPGQGFAATISIPANR
jgi:signal transduction histidine kinase